MVSITNHVYDLRLSGSGVLDPAFLRNGIARVKSGHGWTVSACLLVLFLSSFGKAFHSYPQHVFADRRELITPSLRILEHDVLGVSGRQPTGGRRRAADITPEPFPPHDVQVVSCMLNVVNVQIRACVIFGPSCLSVGVFESSRELRGFCFEVVILYRSECGA